MSARWKSMAIDFLVMAVITNLLTILWITGKIVSSWVNNLLYGTAVTKDYNITIYFSSSALVIFCYFCFLEISEIQGSFGKNKTGLKVVDKNGERLKIKQTLVRNIARLFSMYLFFIGYIIAFFRKDNRTLHDIVSDTYIVKE